MRRLSDDDQRADVADPILERGLFRARVCRRAPVIKKSILEESVVRVIRDGLNACRVPNYRVRERIVVCPRCRGFVGRPSEEGIPDLVGWIPAVLWPGEGRSVPLFIEVKRPKGGIESEAQKQFLERAHRDGGIAMIARSWDAVADTLRRAGVKVPKGL